MKLVVFPVYMSLLVWNEILHFFFMTEMYDLNYHILPISPLRTQLFSRLNTVNVLKFQTTVACQKFKAQINWEDPGSLSPVCYSDKQFVNSSPDYHYFILRIERSSKF